MARILSEATEITNAIGSLSRKAIIAFGVASQMIKYACALTDVTQTVCSGN